MKWNELKDNPKTKIMFDQRHQIIRLTREWFWAQGFVETATPIAVVAPDQEPHLSPILAEFHDERRQSSKFYLRTSPEYSLKKLLAAGYEKIFEIGACFRDYEESGDTHNHEFTMLEWYRAPGAYEEIMDDLENLFKFIGKQLGLKNLNYKNIEVSWDNAWERISMKDLWQKYVQVNLDEYLEKEKIIALARSLGYQAEAEENYEDVFYKIFLNKIEPHLGHNQPTIVYEYPAKMAALARVCPRRPGYAERFELYVAGLEVANAFGELTDSSEQLQRFETEKAIRENVGKSVLPIDNELVFALKSITTASGIALGVDRMVMLFAGARDIDKVIFQTVQNQLEN